MHWPGPSHLAKPPAPLLDDEVDELLVLLDEDVDELPPPPAAPGSTIALPEQLAASANTPAKSQVRSNMLPTHLACAMSWLLAAIYDPMIKQVERACMKQWRGDLLQQAEGTVLEVGAGTGANVAHYPSGLESLTLTEPDPHMRARLEQRAEGLEVRDAAVERLPFSDGSFDTVVCTLVLCSVTDLDRSVAELRRVLRPGGQLLFIEHGAAEPGSSRLRWQHRFEPLWKRVFGNCHFTRRADLAFEKAGFQLEQVQRESMRKAMALVRPTVRGVARRAAD